MLTFWTGRRTNHLGRSRLHILHIDAHRDMAKQEIAQTHSQHNHQKQIAIVDHDAQHQRIAKRIVQQEDASLAEQLQSASREATIRAGRLISDQQIGRFAGRARCGA